MTRRAWSAAWCAWAVVIALRYFTVPADPILLTDGAEAFPADHWVTALQRASFALLGAGAVLITGWVVGRGILWRARSLFHHRGERLLFELGVGLGCLSHILLGFGFLGGFRPASVILLLAMGGAVAAAMAMRNDAWRLPPMKWPASALDLLLLTCAAAAGLFALVGALAPETEYDALWYHLWLPTRWLASGAPVDVVDEYVSLYPLTWDLLFGAAMVAGGSVGAKLLHFATLPLLAATTWRLAIQLCPGVSGPAVVALLTAAPIVTWEATTAYVDLALVWYVTLAALALLRFQATRASGWLWLAASTMGLALAIKHLALVVLVLGCAVLLVLERRHRPRMLPAVRTVVLFVAISLVVPAPWYIRAYVRSGNPVFPDMYSVFGARPEQRWDDLSERSLRGFKDRFGARRDAASLLKLPWDVTVHGQRYGGAIGPIFLVLVPAALAVGCARWLLLLCGGYLLVWASPLSSFQMRFLLPLLPFLAIACAAGLNHLPRVAGWVVLLLSFLNLPPFIEWHERDRIGWTGWLTHVVRGTPMAVVIGGEPASAYLARRVPSFRAWDYINTHLPGDVRVLTFAGGDHLYSDRDRLWSDATRAREVTWGAATGEVPPSVVRQRLSRLGITHVLIDRRQLEGAAGTLTISSRAMETCCYTRIFDDGRFVLYRVD